MSIAILQKVKKMASEINGFLLPGGDDVPPALYGHQQLEGTNWGNDYRRSFLEISMIHEAYNKGIPLMGICRGFQITSVYFGAQLTQGVKYHNGPERYNLAASHENGLYTTLRDKSFVGWVSHHHAVPVDAPPTQHLQPVVTYNGLVKIAEPFIPASAPMILTQFHPENYKIKTANCLAEDILEKIVMPLFLSEENDFFWELLFQSINTHHRRKKVLRERPLKTALG